MRRTSVIPSPVSLKRQVTAPLCSERSESLTESGGLFSPGSSAAATFTARREYLFDRTGTSAHCRTLRFTSPREFIIPHAWLRAARPAACYSGRAESVRDFEYGTR
jgi:hypothetical protein